MPSTSHRRYRVSFATLILRRVFFISVFACELCAVLSRIWVVPGDVEGQLEEGFPGPQRVLGVHGALE